jgi:hypothetical protein
LRAGIECLAEGFDGDLAGRRSKFAPVHKEAPR